MRFNSEVELRDSLGLDSWRNLSKDTVFRLLEQLPDTDPEVALKLISQLPEITSFAQAALDDTAKAHEITVTSNARSQEMVHQVHIERLMILKAELDKDLTPEERIRVLDDVREVNSNAIEMDTQGKAFLSEQFDKRLTMVVGTAVTVVAVVAAIAKSGNRPGGGIGKIFRS